MVIQTYVSKWGQNERRGLFLRLSLKKTTFMGGEYGTTFGAFAFPLLTMQIYPSSQRGDEEPCVFIINRIQTHGLQPAGSL